MITPTLTMTLQVAAAVGVSAPSPTQAVVIKLAPGDRSAHSCPTGRRLHSVQVANGMYQVQAVTLLDASGAAPGPNQPFAPVAFRLSVGQLTPLTAVLVCGD